jgi:hypothetical protein
VERDIRPVDRLDAGGAGMVGDLAHRPEPLDAREDGVGDAELEARDPHAHLVVPDAEDERLDPVRGADDLAHRAGSALALDEDLEPDRDAAADLRLEPAQQVVHEVHVVRSVDLGDHQAIEPVARARDDLHDVAHGIRRRDVVDADGADLALVGMSAQGVDRVLAARDLLRRGARVLEVDEQLVARQRVGLGEHLRARRRHREAGAPPAGSPDHESSSRRRTMNANALIGA